MANAISVDVQLFTSRYMICERLGSICFPSDLLINFKSFCWSDTIWFNGGNEDVWGFKTTSTDPSFPLA
jgi:hypothetical protein